MAEGHVAGPGGIAAWVGGSHGQVLRVNEPLKCQAVVCLLHRIQCMINTHMQPLSALTERKR